MALTLLGDLIPYANQFRQGYIDNIVEASNVFNGASRGCIRFQDSDAIGTVNKFAYFKDFGTVSRRDITSTSDQTPEKIERAEHTNFRTYFKLNAIEWMDEAFNTADGMGQDAIMYMVGAQLARKKLRESITQAINICSTAIESGDGAGGETVLDLITGTPKNFLQTDINKARMKFGEHYTRLQLMVMHSSVFFVLTQNQTVNYSYDLGGGVTLYGGIPATMGIPFIVTDQPGLVYTTGSGDTAYKTLLLTDGAVTVGDAGAINAGLNTILGKENILHGYQAEWSMWNNVKGYQLKAAAGTNPTDSALTTVSNWEQWVADKRNTAGVLVKSLADLEQVQQVFNVRYVS